MGSKLSNLSNKPAEPTSFHQSSASEDDDDIVVDTDGLEDGDGHDDEKFHSARQDGKSSRRASYIFQPLATEPTKNKDEATHPLEMDTYSIMFTSRPLSVAFLFGLIVFTLQLFVIVLMAIDLLNKGDGKENNPLAVPVYVEPSVTMAQFIAIILTVISQDDATTSIFDLVALQHDKSITDINPYATYVSWIFAVSTRLVVGLLAMAVSVLFIIQSETVLSIFQNFAAVAFVTHVDDIVYFLASRGYLRKDLELAAERVEAIQMPKRQSAVFYNLRLWILLGIMAGMMTGWAVIRARQKDGYYLQQITCQLVQVEFGDEYFYIYGNYTVNQVLTNLEGTMREYAIQRWDTGLPTVFYAAFNGLYAPLYKGEKLVTRSHRPVYVEKLRYFNGAYRPMEDPPDETRAKFFYCEAMRRWVFTSNVLYAGWEDCKNEWMVRSPETLSYTLTDAPKAGWTIWTGRESDASSLSIICDDCNDFGAGECNWDEGAVCNADGTCTCNVMNGWTGNRCIIEPACEELDQVQYGSASLEYREIGGYKILRDPSTGHPLESYNRPIYTRTKGNDIFVLIFAGRRWFNARYEVQAFRQVFLEATAPFHAYWDSRTAVDETAVDILYASEPVNPDGPLAGSPLRLNWNYVGGSLQVGTAPPFESCFDRSESQTMWTCHADKDPCEENNWCRNGVCGSNRTCECSDCWGGYFCEVEPQAFYVRDVPPESSQYNLLFWQNNATCLELAAGPGPGEL